MIVQEYAHNKISTNVASLGSFAEYGTCNNIKAFLLGNKKTAGFQLRVHNIFLFLNQNICDGYSNVPSPRDDPFAHPTYM